MAERHLSRLMAPKSWPMHKKENKWIIRPNPGPHKLMESIPLGLIIRNILNQARTLKEVKKILINGSISVDGKVRKDYKFPVGVMDIVKVANDSYRVLFSNKGKFRLKPIKKDESNIKPCKIINKKMVRGNKLQVTLYDGKNIFTDNSSATNDTLIIDLAENKVNSSIKFEKGAIVYIINGKYIGRTGKIVDLEKGKKFKDDKVLISIGKDNVKTLSSYCIAVGKDKPAITLE